MPIREVSVVTGASSGIGRATARRLAGTGGMLVLADVVPLELDDYPGAEDVVFVRCDITDRAEVEALAETAAAAGAVRNLVHAAGISPSMGSPSAVFSVDLLGSVHIAEAFEGAMTSGGAAVLVASMAARFTPPGETGMDAVLADPLAEGAVEAFLASDLVNDHPGLAYAWAKLGVVRLTARSAAPWGRRGLRINSVSPGTIDTPMGQREMAAEPMMTSMLEQTPAGRVGEPDDIARVIAFLLSDDAAYVTGTDVLVDGGISATLGI